VDDDDGLTLVSVPNPVPIAGHFNQALMGHFCQAPKYFARFLFKQSPKQVAILPCNLPADA